MISSEEPLFPKGDYYTYGLGKIQFRIYEYDKTFYEWEKLYNKYNSNPFIKTLSSFIESLGHKAHIHYSLNESERYIEIIYKGSYDLEEFEEEIPKFEKLILEQWNNVWSKVIIPKLSSLIISKLCSGNLTFLSKSVAYGTKLYGIETTLDILYRFEIIK